MANWSRRRVLEALAWAGSSPAWLPLWGCGNGQRAAAIGPLTATSTRAIGDIDSLRDQLRQAVADLRRRFPHAYGSASVGYVTNVAMDEDERVSESSLLRNVRLAVWAKSGWRELGSSNVSAKGLRQLSQRLDSLSPGQPRQDEPAAVPSLAGGGPEPELDPRDRPAHAWMERIATLFERARMVGSSRVVYRRASLMVQDTDEIFVGHDRDYAQRCLRSRAVAGFVVFDGSQLIDESAIRIGATGLEITDVPDDDLARAAASAMVRLTGRMTPSGSHWMMLDSTVAAALVRHGVVARWDGSADSSASPLTVTDDPTHAGAFGGYRFDDEGWPGQPTRVFEGGRRVARLTDRELATRLGIARTGNGRGASFDSPARPRPSHLLVEPGAASDGDLMTALGSGFLIESAIDSATDPQSGLIAIRARRAREVADGRTTGRSYGPVVVAGSADEMLSSVRAIGSAVSPSGWLERDGSRHVAISASAPALVTAARMSGGGG